MPYLSNVAINRLNVHTGLHMLAVNLAGMFLFVFIMAQGFSGAQTFVIFAGILVTRFMLRPLILPAGIALGLNRTILIGGALFALQYILLIFVNGINAHLFLFILVSALGDVFYWCSYHAIFGQMGDAEHRGKQLGVRQALTTLSAIFAPLLGGWGLQHVGPAATFGTAAVVQLLAMVPLLKLPPIPVARHTSENPFKAARIGALLFITDGWIASGFVWGWAIVVFGSAHNNFTLFGAVAALGGLVAALGNLVLGKWMDAGKSSAIIYANAACLAVALLLRASAGHEIGFTFAIAAASSSVDALYGLTFGTVYYNLVQQAPCPLRYTFVTEGAWDTGGIVATLLSALILHFGAAPGWTVALALLAVLPQAYLLRRYYAKSMAHKKTAVAMSTPHQ